MLLQLAASLAGSSHVSAALLPARPSSRLLRVRAGRLALPGLLHTTDAQGPNPSLHVKLVSQDAARLRLAVKLALLLLPPPARADAAGTGAAMKSSLCA